MAWISAIYKCPQSRTELIIYDDLKCPKTLSAESPLRKNIQNHSPEEIVKFLNRSLMCKDETFLVKLVPASDFLKALHIRKCEKLGSSNQSIFNPESFDLLAICLQKNSNLPGKSNTCKILDEMPEEDVIEVFI